MAFFVKRLIVINLHLPVLFGRDAGDDILIGQRAPKPIAVVTAICDQVFGFRQGSGDESRAFMIAHLPFGKQQDQRFTVAIGDSMQFGV